MKPDQKVTKMTLILRHIYIGTINFLGVGMSSGWSLELTVNVKSFMCVLLHVE